MSMIFFILEYAPLVMLKASYLSMESILIPILRYGQNKFFCLYFDRINHSPLCVIMELYSCTIPKNPVLLLNCSAQKSELHHQLEHFNFKFDFNLNQLDDVNFDHLSERTLCAMPHIGCQFMSCILMSMHRASQIQ